MTAGSAIKVNCGKSTVPTASVLQAASVSIVNSNLIPALRVNLGPIDSISVTPIDVGQPEFLFFVNAHCANC